MPLDHSLPSSAKSNIGQRSERSLSAGFVLAVLCFCALPATAQNAPCSLPLNSGVKTPANGTFESNFILNGSLEFDYGVAINASNGANAGGDLNSSYAQLFYSINNLNNIWIKNGWCPIELVIAGTYPNARYFSVTVNDMHYSATHHLADLAIDTAQGEQFENPYLPNPPGSTNNYQPGQYYFLPISLGYVPIEQANGGLAQPTCAITLGEQDNLLDATQRHMSMDWNMELLGNIPPKTHVVDSPAHTLITENQAGSIILRSYLAPPYTGCGQPGSVNCTAPPAVPTQYLIVRDAQSGCAYSAKFVNATASLLNQLAPSSLNCLAFPQSKGCNAILSDNDLSGTTTAPVSNWLDQVQFAQHVTHADITPEACYNNGDPTQLSVPSSKAPWFYNRVAWTRSPEWRGSPGPDDSYIGGAVSSGDLAQLAPLSGNPLCPDGCVMRLRFKLPPTPNIPCVYPNTGHPCYLTGNEALRYMSLTFWYQSTSCPAKLADHATADPDGFAPHNTCAATSIISLADTAFAANADGYVTLLVNANPNVVLRPWWSQTYTGGTITGQVKGVMPVQPPTSTGVQPYFSVWSVNNGTVLGSGRCIYPKCDVTTLLDLTQFPSFTTAFNSGVPILMTIRNSMPSNSFACSGSAVPFSTAEYTNLTVDGKQTGSGLMGPYVPLVDYPDIAQLSPAPPSLIAANLPPESLCGTLNAAYPSFTPSSPPLNWPTQYWPSSPTYPLVCGPALDNPPAIYFVGTQFTTPASAYESTNGVNCVTSTQPNPCNQVIVQSPQQAWELPAGEYLWAPPLPVTIVGTGFGTLPNTGLPFAVQNPPYLNIQDCAKDSMCTTPLWDTRTAVCQVYVSNWTDRAISLTVGLPAAAINGAHTLLPPLDDISPQTFFQVLQPPSTIVCPVAQNDILNFTVTNPQRGVPLSIQVTVSPAGTQPN